VFHHFGFLLFIVVVLVRDSVRWDIGGDLLLGFGAVDLYRVEDERAHHVLSPAVTCAFLVHECSASFCTVCVGNWTLWLQMVRAVTMVPFSSSPFRYGRSPRLIEFIGGRIIRLGWA
jgi:hypothetical protein